MENGEEKTEKLRIMTKEGTKTLLRQYEGKITENIRR